MRCRAIWPFYERTLSYGESTVIVGLWQRDACGRDGVGLRRLDKPISVESRGFGVGDRELFSPRLVLSLPCVWQSCQLCQAVVQVEFDSHFPDR